MKKVFICSPFRAAQLHIRREYVAYAKALCRYALRCGLNPLAPHLFLPQVLDDMDPAARDLGMMCGRQWLEACDLIWIGIAFGVSEGMQVEIERAKVLKIPAAEAMPVYLYREPKE